MLWVSGKCCPASAHAAISLHTTVCPALTRAGCAAQCTRFIYGYMAFAGFSIFFTLTGLIALQLIVRFNVVLDAVSFAFILYNFAVRLRLQPQGLG